MIRITVAHGEKDYQVLLKERLSKMPAATKDHNRKYEAIEKLLLAQKAHLTKQVNGRVNETMLLVAILILLILAIGQHFRMVH